MDIKTTFKRYELKYIIDKKQKEIIVNAMKEDFQLDNFGISTIRNIYFDTLDYRIIRYCLDNRLLFESADFHNAVFVGHDKDGKARYGALRSTVSSYKGELTGSDKRFSFFLEGKPNAEHIHVFESAIDLLSFATLTLLAGRDWKSETYLSLAGVFQTKRENVVPVALSRFLDEHPSVRKIHLHLDNDAVGRGAVKGIVGGLQGRYQVYDEPPSRGKDVNDELKIRVGLMRERKERERT